MDHIQYQVSKIILKKYLKKNGEKTVNLSMRIYMNKIENKITFKIKAGYYLKLLTSETTKLLRNTKSKVPKNEYGEVKIPKP